MSHTRYLWVNANVKILPAKGNENNRSTEKP